MKKVLLIVLCTLIAVSAQAQQKQKRFLIKSGHIKYELTGNTTGTKEMWWDDYGDKTCETVNSVTVTKIFGMKSESKSKTKTIIIKDKFWAINYLDESASKGTVPYYEESHEMVEDMTEEELRQWGEDMIESLGGERLANEKFMGYDCEVFTVLGSKIWIYRGVSLKLESEILGVTANEIASKFEPNTSVSASIFKPATDVTYEEMDAKMDAMYGGMMDAYNENDYDDGDDDTSLAPLSYSFENFKKALEPLKKNGFKKITLANQSGVYAGTYMKGFGKIFTMMALSEDNAKEQEAYRSDSFTHNGHRCWYTDEDETSLLVEYKEHGMYFVITSTFETSQEDLLEIADMCKF
jgi:hypothetical protein